MKGFQKIVQKNVEGGYSSCFHRVQKRAFYMLV